MAKFTLKRGEQFIVNVVLSGDAAGGDWVDISAGTGAGIKGGVAPRGGVSGETVGVDVGANGSSYMCEVDGAYAIGVPLFEDGAAGAQLTSTGNLFGYAVEASGQAGDVIEVALNPVIAPTAA